MTRKDYVLIADAIAEVEAGLAVFGRPDESAQVTLRNVIEALDWRLSRDNPRFDSDRFARHAMPLRARRLDDALREARDAQNGVGASA